MSEDGWEADSELLIDGFPPAASTMQVQFGAESRKGRSRGINEDNYLVLEIGRHQQTILTSLPETLVGRRFDEFGYAMVVADGMGGNGTGDKASQLALATLVQLVLYYGRWNLRVNERVAREILDRAERFYRRVDSTITFENVTGPVSGLKTTLTATFGAGQDLFFAHVGHSRAYLLRDGDLMRLTRDHTVGPGRPTRVGMAPLVDVNAAARDLKHVLTGAMGMTEPTSLKIDLERLRLRDRDLILVCTNGVTDALDESDIATILRTSLPPGEQCRNLVDRAIASDGQDDATALIGHFHFP